MPLSHGHAFTRLLARLRREEGFTMVAVMGTMVAIMGLSVAAFAAASGDGEGNAYDRESKQAYAAAEAGLNDYLYHLNQDNAFWAKCDSVPDPSAVNQRGSQAKRRTVPGTPADYAIELLPAPGNATCDTNAAATSMIDPQTGTFRIRSTGRMPTGNGNYAKRSIITTFKRRGFLDFLYFTDLETSDPAWYELQAGGLLTGNPNPALGVPTMVGWASTECAKYWRDGRGSERYFDADGNGTQDGHYFQSGSWFRYSFFTTCSAIQFAPGDRIRGPLHTNDELLVCGSPTFGRSAQDEIEVSADTPGWRPSCSGAAPNFVGTFVRNSPILAMPPSNNKLSKIAEPAYLFTGTTTITLNGANMTVTNPSMGLSNVSRPLPPNGVIYVKDGVCGQGYKPLSPYTGVPAGCGDVYVRGTYSKDLTIAAEKDVIVTDDLLRSGDTVLGLVANQFVRVYHPVQNLNVANRDCDNNGGPGNIRIDAAILALQHSFTVDHYFCGAPTGTLTVNGVIAQKFRGPVGTGGSSISTGYVKDYNYDDRLSLRQPPNFLDPVQSAWRVQRQTEQTPAP